MRGKSTGSLIKNIDKRQCPFEIIIKTPVLTTRKKNQSEINTHANMPEGSAQTVEMSKSHSIFMLLTAVVFSCSEESGA